MRSKLIGKKRQKKFPVAMVATQLKTQESYVWEDRAWTSLEVNIHLLLEHVHNWIY